MKLSEDTPVSLPAKNLIAIVAGAVMAAWFGFGVIERLNSIETQLQLIKNIEGWYHQDNISTCLSAKRLAERNSGNQVQYTCTLEQCMMTTDQTGVKHCDKIIKD